MVAPGGRREDGEHRDRPQTLSPECFPAVEQLWKGDIEAKRRAVEALVGMGAERALLESLQAPDVLISEMASGGLWELWSLEKGPEARDALDGGVRALNSGEITRAKEVFRYLIALYPDWAEPVNKLATVLFLVNRASESVLLFKKAVALKPSHFGAWNGLAMAAMQVHDWDTAKRAAERAVAIMPGSAANRELLRIVSESE